MSDIKNGRGTPVVQPVWDQDGSPRDDARAPGTSGEVAGITGADWLLYGVVAAVAFGIGIVNALSIAQDAVRRGGAYDLTTPMFWEMSSIVVIVLAAPVLFFAVRRMRREAGWLPRIGVGLAGIVAFSSLHIAGMVGIRKLAMFLVGGSYDFHFSAGTLIYEFRKDVITCLLMGGALWLIDRRRGAQQLRQDFPNVVWIRDGSIRIRIEPRNIVLGRIRRKLCRVPHRGRQNLPDTGNTGRRRGAAAKIWRCAGASHQTGQPVARDWRCRTGQRRFRANAGFRRDYFGEPPLPPGSRLSRCGRPHAGGRGRQDNPGLICCRQQLRSTPLASKFCWDSMVSLSDFECIRSSTSRIKPLLFAPRLMLERGLQFTERRSLSPTTPDHPLPREVLVCGSQMKPAQSG